MIFGTIALGSTPTITLLDETRHYFGGYFHVKMLAYCDIPLEQSYFENEAEFRSAVGIMGISIRFERILEKMAVPESEISSVLTQLKKAFLETTCGYLSAPDFAPCFVRSEYRKRINKASPIRSFRV